MCAEGTFGDFVKKGNVVNTVVLSVGGVCSLRTRIYFPILEKQYYVLEHATLSYEPVDGVCFPSAPLLSAAGKPSEH